MKLKHCVPSKDQEPPNQWQCHIPDYPNPGYYSFEVHVYRGFWRSNEFSFSFKYWPLLLLLSNTVCFHVTLCFMNTNQFSFSSESVFLQALCVITNNKTFVVKQSLLHFYLSFHEDAFCNCFLNSLLCTFPCLISAPCSWSGQQNWQYLSYKDFVVFTYIYTYVLWICNCVIKTVECGTTHSYHSWACTLAIRHLCKNSEVLYFYYFQVIILPGAKV